MSPHGWCLWRGQVRCQHWSPRESSGGDGTGTGKRVQGSQQTLHSVLWAQYMPAGRLMTVTKVNYIKHSWSPRTPAPRCIQAAFRVPAEASLYRVTGSWTRCDASPGRGPGVWHGPVQCGSDPERPDLKLSGPGDRRARRPRCGGRGTGRRQSQRTRTVLLPGPCAAGTHMRSPRTRQRHSISVQVHVTHPTRPLSLSLIT